MAEIKSFIIKNALYLALAQAVVAVLGSLYFSEIMNFPPCALCWWQRICIFPLFITLTVGILRHDVKVYLYVLPPAIIGWCIALYHNLLYYRWIPDTLAPCSAGISCVTRFVEYFGFITIPLLAFTAFTVIITLMLVQRDAVRKSALM